MDKRKLAGIVIIVLIIWILILRSSWTDFSTRQATIRDGDTDAQRPASDEQASGERNMWQSSSNHHCLNQQRTVWPTNAPSVRWPGASVESIKLLCIVLTVDSMQHQDRVRAVMDTWGRRCDKLILVRNGTELEESSSSSSPPSSDRYHHSAAQVTGNITVLTVPLAHEGRDELWHKVIAAFEYLHKNYLRDFDWFMKADDDTYVMVDNLKQFLAHAAQPNEPVYFGHKFKPLVHQGYMSGGSGYVLSKRALDLLVSEGFARRLRSCHMDSGIVEDAEMGSCLQAVGVAAGDTRDSEGRPRFLPLAPSYLLTQPVLEWYNAYEFYGPPKRGKDCCSQEPVSFHYITWQQMYLIDWLLYDVRMAHLSDNTNQVSRSTLAESSATSTTTTETTADTSTKTLSVNISATQ